jgi:outer membrane protein
MINVKKITVFMVGLATVCSGLSAQTVERPAEWTLSNCIEYALQQNISVRRTESLRKAAALMSRQPSSSLPSLSFSTSQNYVNRPLAEDNSQKKKQLQRNYGLNASWTVYNGGRNLKTIEQQKLNSRIAELTVSESENDIQTSITQIYVQVLYAAESVKINESTLKVSEAQRDRAKELLAAGSIAQSDYAQLESQCSTDKYQLVTAQAALQNYKLQLKQLLELDGEEEMQIAMPPWPTPMG